MCKVYYGVGIDDTGEVNAEYRGNKMLWMCPIFSRWKGMIRRCYKPSIKGADGCYIDTETKVCSEWVHLSAFKAWMESHDWNGRDMDKDFLCVDESIYSPETCAFVSKPVNYFLGNGRNVRGDWPLGVSYDKARRKYASHVRREGKSVGLGRFATPQQAHRAYQLAKIDAGHALLEKHAADTDPRVVNSIRVILQKISDDVAAGAETTTLLPIIFPEHYKAMIR